MAILKKRLKLHHALAACLLALSACAEQPAINPSIEYAAALSSFAPKTPEGTDCKHKCEQAWEKCNKSTYACDRDGSACIETCAENYTAPSPDLAVPESTGIQVPVPESATVQTLPQEQPLSPTTPLPDIPEAQVIQQEPPIAAPLMEEQPQTP